MGSVLKHLMTPLNVGPFELRNRIISTAHTTVYNPLAGGLFARPRLQLAAPPPTGCGAKG